MADDEGILEVFRAQSAKIAKLEQEVLSLTGRVVSVETKFAALMEEAKKIRDSLIPPTPPAPQSGSATATGKRMPSW